MAEAGTEQGVAMAKKTVTREVHQKMYGEERDKMIEATTPRSRRSSARAPS
jgi:hypothetical protein